MIKRLFYSFLFIAILVGISFLFWIQSQRYSPSSVSRVEVKKPVDGSINSGASIGILLWNISYGGMPAGMDFFYSGGTKIALEESAYHKNIKGILSEIFNFKDSTDIFLFHKVDTASKRSYHTNQYHEIQKLLPEYESSFCLNFANPFIPVPLDKPIGSVYSGMLTLSKFHADSTKRIAFSTKQKYYWPKRLFTAQKCMSITEYPINNKKLFIVNVHLDSYDFRGEIRLAQLKQVERTADSLYKLGNYVVVAGGWNMNPPNFKKYRIKYGYKGSPSFPEIDDSLYFKNWQFEYNRKIPTSRSLKDAYRHGAINTFIKDFFICSPNTIVLFSETIGQEFVWSDHHPVYLRINLY